MNIDVSILTNGPIIGWQIANEILDAPEEPDNIADASPALSASQSNEIAQARAETFVSPPGTSMSDPAAALTPVGAGDGNTYAVRAAPAVKRAKPAPKAG